MCQMSLLRSLGITAHLNYKHAAPLALKPLKTQVVNYAQASINRSLCE